MRLDLARLQSTQRHGEDYFLKMNKRSTTLAAATRAGEANSDGLRPVHR
jgi:hypothetical protein